MMGGEVVRPDVCGLPVFKVNAVSVEVSGNEVNIACGFRMFGDVNWLYVVTMTHADYLAAKDAYHTATLMIERVLSLAH